MEAGDGNSKHLRLRKINELKEWEWEMGNGE